MVTESILYVVNPNSEEEQINQYYKLCNQEFTNHIASSVAEAKKKLENESIDLVVSAMDLSDGNGVELHRYICENFHNAIRFLYLEELDKNIIYKSAGFIHQYLSKECEPEQFNKITNNAFKLHSILTNKELHDRLAGITNLPSPPEIYSELVIELQHEDPSMRQIAELLKKDISLLAKVLHMVNSAFFGLSTHIENPLHAVNLLGIETIQSMVLTAGVFNQFEDPNIPGYSLESIYNTSLAVGASSRHLANAFGLLRKHTEEALMAGMLHDIGKLVMLSYFPNEFEKSVALASDESIPLFEAEKKILGVSDAELGAHLLSLWGLPNPIIEAIALHYNPNSVPAPMTNVLTAVHLGYALNHDITNNVRDNSQSAVDMKYLDQLNLSNNVESLKNFCLAATV